MQTMYPGMPNSPQTELAQAIDDQQTTIPLLDASKLPPAPNLAVIGTDDTAETVLYTGVEGNNLTGVTRGFQGVARSWSAGAKVARNFTAYDYDALRENLEDHAAATIGVHGATSAATPNTLVQRDEQGRIKAAEPSDPDDVARKAEVDSKVSKSGDTIFGELSIQAPGQNIESAVNLIDNTGIRKGRLFYHLNLDRVVFRKYSPSGEIAADLHFNESEFRYRVGSTYYDVYHHGNTYAAATGSANTYSVTLTPAPTSYFDGMPVSVKINVDNTGASTLNVNGLGARALKKPNGSNFSAGELAAGGIYTFRYNATTGNFILQGEGGEGKRWATGTKVAENISGVGDAIRVTGLSFTPRYIIAYAISKASGDMRYAFSIYSDDGIPNLNSGSYFKSARASYSNTSSVDLISQSSVQSGGFTLVVSQGSGVTGITYRWYAFE